MEAITKRKIKSGALTPVVMVLEGSSLAWRKTGKRAINAVKHTYWDNRVFEIHEEIKNCPNCEANYIRTGFYDPQDWCYCDEHRPEVTKIIDRHNRTNCRW